MALLPMAQALIGVRNSGKFPHNLPTIQKGDSPVERAAEMVRPAPEWRAGYFGLLVRQTWPAPVFVIGYLALDRLSFIGALHGIGITPWSPSSGLMLALLIIKGPRYAPLVMAAELLSSATLPVASVFAMPVFLESLVVTACCTGAGRKLAH